ncbi:hypothetical protein NBRC116590_18040 [Pelagimonas sp. KU-00592-HH]
MIDRANPIDDLTMISTTIVIQTYKEKLLTLFERLNLKFNWFNFAVINLDARVGMWVLLKKVDPTLVVVLMINEFVVFFLSRSGSLPIIEGVNV